MEGELKENSEKERAKTPFDALLVHVYFIERVGKEGKERFVPDIASNMDIIAAAQIYQENLTGKIIITCGNAIGKGAPAISEVFKKRLVDAYHIPEEDILVDDQAVDTKTETERSLAIAKENNFQNLMALCLGFHKERVDKFYRFLGADVTTTTAERWLSRRSKKHEEVVKGILASEWFRKRYLEREKRIKVLMLVDRKGEIAKRLSKRGKGRGNIKNAFPRYPTRSRGS
jgi:hypothetical protein